MIEVENKTKYQRRNATGVREKEKLTEAGHSTVQHSTPQRSTSQRSTPHHSIVHQTTPQSEPIIHSPTKLNSCSSYSTPEA